MAKPKAQKAKSGPGPQTVADVKPAAYNPRTISPEQFETLGRSMKEHGDLSGVVFNVRTQNTVGGHQRIKELDPKWPIVKQPAKDSTGTVALGYIDTPYGRFSYREVDWSEAKEKQANLAANRISGEFDYDAVAKILRDLENNKADLTMTGFDAAEIESMLKGMDGEVQDIGGNLHEKFEVAVECADEADQKAVYDKLTSEGRKCKLITI